MTKIRQKQIQLEILKCLYMALDNQEDYLTKTYDSELHRYVPMKDLELDEDDKYRLECIKDMRKELDKHI